MVKGTHEMTVGCPRGTGCWLYCVCKDTDYGVRSMQVVLQVMSRWKTLWNDKKRKPRTEARLILKKEKKKKKRLRKNGEVGRKVGLSRRAFPWDRSYTWCRSHKKIKENGNGGGPPCLFLPPLVIVPQSPLTHDPSPTMCSSGEAVRAFCWWGRHVTQTQPTGLSHLGLGNKSQVTRDGIHFISASIPDETVD